jgi:hypothetical protein
MRPSILKLTAWMGPDAEARPRPRREMRRDRRALRPCLEGCEPRLLLSSTGSGGITIYTGSGQGGFGSGSNSGG